MDLSFSPREFAFQDEVRRFFSNDYPQDILAKLRGGQMLTKADHVASQQALNARGWLGVGWPKEFGGTGWSGIERYLFDEELERAGAPGIIPMAVIYIGPIICAFGTPEQQFDWLPDILNSRSFWAQGYSEPGSGSDLASLSFSATREGDHYVLNGSKIWTTGAHMADWIFCLCRTSTEARKQAGITMICADLRTQGIAIRPIVSIDGRHELNQVFFDNVRVPFQNRIGNEGEAWHYANVLLKNERLSYAHIARKKLDLETVRELANGDRAFLRRVAAVEIELKGIEIAVLNALIHDAPPAMVASLKILCTEMAQKITELFIEIAGEYRAPWFDRTRADWHDATPDIPRFAAPATATYFFDRAQTIYGGTTEIQKNLVWRAIGG